jgi:hypothetical protein
MLCGDEPRVGDHRGMEARSLSVPSAQERFRAVAGPPYAPAAVEALLAEIDDAQGGRMSADR